jgi:trimethylamine--corrinoid protein Co-methyltransferase
VNLQLRSQMRLFDDATLQRLLDQALIVLREVPFRVQGTDEFFDLLTSFGCRVEGECVRFPQAVIECVLERCARSRQAAQASRPPEGQWHTTAPFSVFTHGQALHICDPETNQLRPAREPDLAAWCHLVDALGITRREHPTFIPTDAPVPTSDLHAFVTIILNSRQPHRVSVYSARTLPYFIEAAEVAMGSLEAVRAAPPFATKAWVTSPFTLDRQNLDIAMDARRLLGSPVVFGHMPVAGASTPVSVAGALVQNTAESLALSAMSLAVNGTPQGIGGSSAVTDMREGFSRQIGPELTLHMLAGAEMHDFLYRGYQTAHGCGWYGAGAGTVGVQSVCEKSMGYALGFATGSRSFGVGCLAFSDVGSPVQLIIDLELVQYFEEMLREVSADDAHVGLPTILEVVGSGGRYLGTDHTAELFREECWLPALFTYRPFMAWQHSPPDMIAAARRRVQQLARTAQNQCPLDASQCAALQDVVRRADAALAG